MAEESIRIQGARTHNLKNLSLDIPKGKLVVITGLSGSGKSSLAFDTIYAEGQRRYVESLSSYARQFLGMMEKPDVDSISGLSPAISIDQKSSGHNPRSTVGTVTEIYDYLRLLFARAGHARSPVTGRRLMSQTVQEIVDSLSALGKGAKADKLRIMLLAPVVKGRKGSYEELFRRLLSQGFVRVRVDGQIFGLEEEIRLDRYAAHHIDIVVDRLVVRGDASTDEDFTKRLTESVETCLSLAEQEMLVHLVDEKRDLFFSEKLVDVETGESFPEVEPHSFSFNSPHGACAQCHGLGVVKEIDPESVLDMDLSVEEGGIRPWSRGPDLQEKYHFQLVKAVAVAEKFSLVVPLKKLAKKHLEILLRGAGDRQYKALYKRSDGRGEGTWTSRFEGVIPNLMRRYEQTDSDLIRRELEEYMEERPCDACHGLRLRPEALAVTIRGRNIVDLSCLSIREAHEWLQALSKNKPLKNPVPSCRDLLGMPPVDESEDELTSQERTIVRLVFREILVRLSFLCDVGLDYLSLNRSARTLSGGEAQRIRLASQIGTGLTGVLYVLDEPSIGLHARDNERLLKTLCALRDLGNSVLVVEHDSDTIRLADHVVDIGPEAGSRGGQVVYSGPPSGLAKAEGLTAEYISGRRILSRENLEAHMDRMNLRATPVAPSARLTLRGVSQNNLKAVDLALPLGKFICITGVSGSGKSSLVNEVLARALAKELHGARSKPGPFKSLDGLEHLDKAIVIDQSPIGRTPRSNPATYTGVFADIRNLFVMTSESRVRGYKPGRFSFNVKGGRCENCQGDGMIKIEMQFLPDVYIACEVCKAKRYNRDTLQVHYKGKTIADVLDMTIEEATEFFQAQPSIHRRMRTLLDVGLGYVQLGQSATTLSGGEAQRIKLAGELARRSTGKTFYILDEPSTGLHFEDVRRLLLVLHSLVRQGNTVLVIEHNLDIVKTADWIVDLGPEGGDRGGKIIAQGTVDEIIKVPGSHTGKWLALHIKEEAAGSKAQAPAPRRGKR